MPDTEYTNPNLHRLIASPDMTGGVKYSVFIIGNESFRLTVTDGGHDEESDDDEIP